MPSSNILLFDANKANMMSDEQYNTNTQRLNGVQSGIASSQLQNKTLYQVSLVAYAIAQIMNQNGLDANDTAAVSAFVANLSGTMLQKVADLASTQEAQAGVATGKWMSPALVKTAIDTLAAKAQNILSNETKTAYGLGSDATPNDAFQTLRNLVSAAQSTANEKVRITCGTYTGQAESLTSDWRTISLGYQPKAVIISSASGSFINWNAMAFPGWPAQARQNYGGGVSMYAGVQITSSGFQVRNFYTGLGSGMSYYMDYADNGGGLIYYYIAFQ